MLTLIFSTFFWEKWLEITKRLKDVPTPNSQNLIKIYGVVNMKQLKIKKISIENFAGLKIKFLNLMAMMQEYTVLMIQENYNCYSTTMAFI